MDERIFIVGAIFVTIICWFIASRLDNHSVGKYILLIAPMFIMLISLPIIYPEKCDFSLEDPVPTYLLGCVLEDKMVGEQYLLKVDVGGQIYTLNIRNPRINLTPGTTKETLDFNISKGTVVKFQTNNAPLDTRSKFDENKIGSLFPDEVKIK